MPIGCPRLPWPDWVRQSARRDRKTGRPYGEECCCRRRCSRRRRRPGGEFRRVGQRKFLHRAVVVEGHQGGLFVNMHDFNLVLRLAFAKNIRLLLGVVLPGLGGPTLNNTCNWPKMDMMPLGVIFGSCAASCRSCCREAEADSSRKHCASQSFRRDCLPTIRHSRTCRCSTSARPQGKPRFSPRFSCIQYTFYNTNGKLEVAGL